MRPTGTQVSLHDCPPRTDLEGEATCRKKEYRLLVCDRQQWVKAETGAFEDKLLFVVEIICSEQEFRNALIVARTDRQFRAYDLYGRRRNNRVELFADIQGRVPKGLAEQFTGQGCTVTVRKWPDDTDTAHPIILNNAIMAKVVAHTNKTLEWAVVTGMQDSDRLCVLPCSEGVFTDTIIAIRSRNPTTALTQQKVSILALVRKNHIIWTCSPSTLAQHMYGATNDHNRLHIVLAEPRNKKDLEVQSKWEWVVPLTVPTAVEALHEPICRYLRAKMRKKVKLRELRQASINAMEADQLDWLQLPAERKLSREAIKRLKEHVQRFAESEAHTPVHHA